MANENRSLVFNLLSWLLLRSLLSRPAKLQSNTANGCRHVPSLHVTNVNAHGEELRSVGQREVWDLLGETTGSFRPQEVSSPPSFSNVARL